MSINDYERSLESGQPVELYHFIYGTNAEKEFFYTNAEKDITYSGATYKALPTAREKIVTKGRGESQELTIEVPLNSAVSEIFRIFPPGRVVNIIIRQGHIPMDNQPSDWDGPQFGVIWTGRVLESTRKKNTTVLTCENSEAGMKRVGLRRHYQWACPLVLYGARCKADKEAAQVTGVVASVAANRVTLQPGWEATKKKADFLGGIFEWESDEGREYRTIVGLTGNTLKLNAATVGLAATNEVDVFLGCPHTSKGCKEVHDNAVNYGGQPFIPLKNPVGKNNHT